MLWLRFRSAIAPVGLIVEHKRYFKPLNWQCSFARRNRFLTLIAINEATGGSRWNKELKNKNKNRFLPVFFLCPRGAIREQQATRCGPRSGNRSSSICFILFVHPPRRSGPAQHPLLSTTTYKTSPPTGKKKVVLLHHSSVK